MFWEFLRTYFHPALVLSPIERKDKNEKKKKKKKRTPFGMVGGGKKRIGKYRRKHEEHYSVYACAHIYVYIYAHAHAHAHAYAYVYTHTCEFPFVFTFVPARTNAQNTEDAAAPCPIAENYEDIFLWHHVFLFYKKLSPSCSSYDWQHKHRHDMPKPNKRE
ncbi:hypothetical protein POVWA1_016430 [Plasmodium ovale wallikeri]|uniref:Uncharacterized protein n=1 Tax=Plasmodium ovale wallikeri TaxID=864142 RepID=A0A1A8YPH0_PLAOA|nr:hypothetical protein POVWA1_016430 [Plasmodium ovale wallikeri]